MVTLSALRLSVGEVRVGQRFRVTCRACPTLGRAPEPSMKAACSDKADVAWCVPMKHSWGLGCPCCGARRYPCAERQSRGGHPSASKTAMGSR